MKRLFILRRGKGGPVIRNDEGQPMYFSTKPEAKQTRDTIGNAVVSIGPDHKLYKGE
jgi:hypothetical protein